MRLYFISLFLLILIIGCGNDYDYDNIVNGDNDTEIYLIESEPSLSPTGDYIYYIAIDTVNDSNSGIYPAAVSNPVREKLINGDNFHSPSLGFDNNTIACLDDSGKIHYFDMSNQTTDTSMISERFESIFFIDEKKLLAHRGDPADQNDSIFLIDETEQVVFFLEGWDPTFFAKETFVYIDADGNNVFYILKNNIITYSHPETLFTITSYPAIPRWPSLYHQSNRLTYCLYWADQRFIYSAKAYESGFNFVDSSDYAKPLILGNDLIIYTGWNGRFCKSDFLGTQSSVFTK